MSQTRAYEAEYFISVEKRIRLYITTLLISSFIFINNSLLERQSESWPSN